MYSESIETALKDVFEHARKVDEFEFACALLRVRGLEDAGWDALEESGRLTEQVLGLIEKEQRSDLRLRLLLFLYCHATEMSDLYAVPMNMLRICSGERYLIDPFIAGVSPGGKAAKQPTTKAKRVADAASEGGFGLLSEVFGYFVQNRVRNAFFHSTYTLSEMSFRITDGPGVKVDGVVTHEIPLSWLLPRVECAINLSMNIVDALGAYRSEYAENRVVAGRLGQDGGLISVELLGGPSGLTGFRSID